MTPLELDEATLVDALVDPDAVVDAPVEEDAEADVEDMPVDVDVIVPEVLVVGAPPLPLPPTPSMRPPFAQPAIEPAATTRQATRWRARPGFMAALSLEPARE